MKLILAVIFLVIVGCATPYKTGVGSGKGYFETRLSDNHYVVSFQGNDATNDKKVYDYALLRAAEIGVELGFDVMVVQGVESTATTSNATYSVPVYNPPADMINGVGTWSASTSSVSSIEPGYRLNVLYFNGEPSGKFISDTIFEPTQTLERLRREYELN